MSNMYAIKEETLSALGDAVRSKALGSKEFYISGSQEFDNSPEPLAYISFSATVKKMKIKGFTSHTADETLSTPYYLSIAPAIYTHVSKAIKDPNRVVIDYYGDFEIIINSNVATLSVQSYNYAPDKLTLSYEVWGLDENGNEFKYTPLEMADKISELDIFPTEALTITGDCSYAFTGKHWKNIFANDSLKNKCKSENITNCDHMFYNSDLKEIPFSISTQNTNINANYFFGYCEKLEYLPELSNTFTLNSFEKGFYSNYRINSIPNSWVENLDMSVINKSTSAKSLAYLCYNHYSLRSFPKELLKRFYDSSTAALSSTNALYNNFFYDCYSLDEVVGIPVYGTITTNRFGNFCGSCSRVKEIIFATNEDGTPKTAKWKSQTIDLTSNVGYIYNTNYIINYNSGITADKEVKDDATYQALKNDPDWFSCDINYSRYNHDSAVNTINSLPDTSAYGTNTIKFKGAAGTLTDGGAINTLTEEEIAVATAKGWTVSLV